MPHAPDLSGCALDDRYELRAVIGEGAFGRVYEGRDRRLERPVAVKVIKPWWAEDPEWVVTFERETRLLARVSDPGIVQIYDVGHAPEGLYYVSELVDGENLASRLRRGPLPAWEACDVAAQLCRALARAHAQRIVHRDVKPANILLSTEGRVKVGDFGVARLAEGSTDGHGAHPPSIVGTPRYMAPEQGRGLPTTPATDVYSVGVVLYEMLSGAPAVRRRLGRGAGVAPPPGAAAAAVTPPADLAGGDRRTGAGQGSGAPLRRRRRDGRRPCGRPGAVRPPGAALARRRRGRSRWVMTPCALWWARPPAGASPSRGAGRGSRRPACRRASRPRASRPLRRVPTARGASRSSHRGATSTRRPGAAPPRPSAWS